MKPILLSQEQIKAASQKYGTPLYLYNLNKISHQFATLSEYLPSNFTIHYAMKANSNLTVCRKLAQLGSSADVSSLGELRAALKVAFSPEQIVFTGPGKTVQELSAAVDVGCGLIVLESVNEARRLNKLAQQHGIQQDVLIRINPIYRTSQSLGSKATIQLISQKASKFGVDEERMMEAIAAIRDLAHLNLKGIHIYTESNVLNCQDLLASWQNTINIANRLREQGHPIFLIDFGGGIGIPYNAIDNSFNMPQFGQDLQRIFDNAAYDYHCLVEIGRYLVGEAGCYVTEVVDIKQSRGQKFIILDGGIHNILRTSMKPASKYMDVLGKKGQGIEKATLAGKLPTPLDFFVEDAPVPSDIEIGDQIVIYNCGAYGFNHSLTNFVLNNYPAEVAYYESSGEMELIRRRGNVDDFFINQKELF